jgi:hypothetical protein
MVVEIMILNCKSGLKIWKTKRDVNQGSLITRQIDLCIDDRHLINMKNLRGVYHK